MRDTLRWIKCDTGETLVCLDSDTVTVIEPTFLPPHVHVGPLASSSTKA